MHEKRTKQRGGGRCIIKHTAMWEGDA